MPKISIIVPNYNHAPFLKQRLESIYNQTFQDFEVILLDDASTDTSLDLLNEYKNHPKTSQFNINKTNSGSPFKQWQKGIELAKGEYIWIAESDDYCELDFLEKMMLQFNSHINLGVVYSRSNKVDEHNKVTEHFWPDKLSNTRWKKDYYNNGIDEISNYLKYRNTIPNASACVISKKCVKKWEDIIEFKYTGDWVFWMNVLKDSNLYFISETLNHFRSHKNSTRDVKGKNSEIQRFIEYSKSIKVANSIIDCKKDFDNSNYNWIYQQLKSSGINFIDIFKNFIELKEFLFPYFRYLYFKNK